MGQFWGVWVWCVVVWVLCVSADPHQHTPVTYSRPRAASRVFRRPRTLFWGSASTGYWIMKRLLNLACTADESGEMPMTSAFLLQNSS